MRFCELIKGGRVMSNENAKLWKALAKYGINSEEELNAEIKKLKPLNIGAMVSPVNIEKENSEESVERI